jgi:putative colanic acid biosynthesis UDP-glucose lipid carrier transferase
LLWSVIFTRLKLDGFRQGWYLPAILSQLFLGVGILIAVLLAAAYMARQFMSRLTLTYFGVILYLGVIVIRFIVHAILKSSFVKSALRRVVIVGNGPVAREMAAKIAGHPELFCRVVGFLSTADAPFENTASAVSAQAVTVQTLGVVELMREQGVDEVIITLAKSGGAEILNLAERCRNQGIGVSVVPHPYELYLSRPQLLDLGGLPVLHLCEADVNSTTAAFKRFFDFTLGLIFSVFSIPVIAVGVVSLLNREGGPFCRELRCGLNGKLFQMYRMNSDRNDASVPKYERTLQQLSITELPQLFNVLIGDMSLVGPRPEPPDRVKHYSDWQRQRLNVKPGMTGLAQVHGLREQHSSEEKARFDLQYMLRRSSFLDLSLLLQTMWTLSGRLFRLRALSSSPDSTLDAVLVEGRLPGAHSTQSSAD